MLQSKDTFNLSTTHSKQDVLDQLKLNTLIKQSLIVENTNKLFIGQVNADGFKIIKATPKGSLCVVKGCFKEGLQNNEIYVETSLQKVYLVLIAIWLIVLAGVTVFFKTQESSLSDLLIMLLLLMAGGFLFRLFVHFAYTLSRNDTMILLETIIHTSTLTRCREG